MGGGRWDTDTYTTARSTRASKGVDDFAYSKSSPTTVHSNLDPFRINSKPFGKLESRDSTEHPNSNAVLVCFDVTGSNKARAVDAQQKLPNLMALLTGECIDKSCSKKSGYLTDPQIAVAANDDFNFVGKKSVQISDFESDNRIDDHIRSIILVGEGGGNNGESYDLIMYGAARKTVLDCFEKRGRKGYFFMYADEPIFPFVSAGQVKDIYGDDLQGEIPIAEIIEELRRQYHVFVIWPQGGYDDAHQQYIKLFGEESVLVLQHPNLICELIGSVIGMNEGLVKTVDEVKQDLLGVGTSSGDATAISTALVPFSKSSAGKTDLPATTTAGASRL